MAKKRDSIWKGNPYGTYKGPQGNPDQWRAAAKAVVRPRMAPPVDAYAVLGLAPGATMAEAKRAYAGLIKENHPDHGGNADKAREIIKAWEQVRKDLTK